MNRFHLGSKTGEIVDDKEVADEKTDLYEVREVFYVILKSGL